jgi:hypothetical protein
VRHHGEEKEEEEDVAVYPVVHSSLPECFQRLEKKISLRAANNVLCNLEDTLLGHHSLK